MTEGVGSDPDAELTALVARFGWAVQHVGAGLGSAAFSYTVGLTTFGHAEVIITGMPFDASQSFLNLVGADVRDGKSFAAGERTATLTDTGSVAFIDAVDDRGLTAVRARYGAVPSLQLIWPDSTGRYPWEVGYRNPPEAQPLLGPIPDTLFTE